MELAATFRHYYHTSPRDCTWLEVVECLRFVKRWDARALLAVLDGVRLAILGAIGGASTEVGIARDAIEADAHGAHETGPVYALKQSKDPAGE